MMRNAAASILAVILVSAGVALPSAAQTVSGSNAAGIGSGSLGTVGAQIGGAPTLPGGSAGSNQRIDGPLNSSLGNTGGAPTPVEPAKPIVPSRAVVAAPGTPPTEAEPLPDGGGSDCICPDGNPANSDGQCLVYRDPQGGPTSEACGQ